MWATGIKPGSPPASGLPGQALTRGFTLIEVLVVVAIVGVIIAVAAVNLFPSDAEIARRQGGDIALAVEHARDAAWFGGRPTAITFSDGRVREWRYAGDRWEADTNRDHRMGADVRITGLYLDGTPLEPGERLVFLPDGLGIPFRVALDVRGMALGVEGDPAGAVMLVER